MGLFAEQNLVFAMTGLITQNFCRCHGFTYEITPARDLSIVATGMEGQHAAASARLPVHPSVGRAADRKPHVTRPDQNGATELDFSVVR
jgi:hypothetical protein